MRETGLKADNILLPSTDDLGAWACIACDQFTSEKDYWTELENKVGDKKSTLKLTLPEIYLEDNAEERIAKINSNIKEYLSNGVFSALDKGFVLTVRKTPYVERRIGLMAAIDLEKYEYSQKSDALIRATEGTIEERIPPRLKIRKDADVEFPHVMVLFDDEKREITERLYENRQSLKKLYDFDLNMGGGHIEGYFVDDKSGVIEKFQDLLSPERLINKYGREDKFLFAVGDGNHSLATAKTHWNNVKKTLTETETKDHPARYALVELVNVYDEGIYFEPIFRYVFGVDTEKFLSGLESVDGGNMKIYADGKTKASVGKNGLPDGIRAVDKYIKEYITENGGGVDYVHGESNLKKLVDENGKAVGILFEKLDKSDLFKYVSKNGAFPRKTFSMGEGVEKRYYLEGRRITK
ncbi:MAG: DUF1015 domain-containing protein [Clostridiales bacterium]|nr:DUF1015 domain-containing protein [Clostridiales bacterium]MBQ3046726.1 DUF1015 domain-containing protein [Clostridia bacterium]